MSGSWLSLTKHYLGNGYGALVLRSPFYGGESLQLNMGFSQVDFQLRIFVVPMVAVYGGEFILAGMILFNMWTLKLAWGTVFHSSWIDGVVIMF